METRLRPRAELGVKRDWKWKLPWEVSGISRRALGFPRPGAWGFERCYLEMKATVNLEDMETLGSWFYCTVWTGREERAFPSVAVGGGMA